MRYRTVVVTALLLAGCTGPDEPVGQVSTTPSSPPGSSGTSRGPVPSPPRTLDLSGHLANPCDLLDRAGLTTLGFAGQFVIIPPERESKDRTCEVGGGSSGGSLHLTLNTESSPLLAAYNDASDEYKYFRTIDVTGFPAVQRARSEEFPRKCAVLVGTAAQQGLTLDHGPSDRDGGTPGICSRLTATAEAVLKKLGA